MPEFCSCGAQLPEDARFCHKCGKPQREEDVAAEKQQAEEAVIAEVIAAPPPPLPQVHAISLRDRVTLSTALIAAGVALMLSVILGPLGLGVLALIAGGFFAVFLYRQRTGQLLTIMNGIRLGWLAGIFVFTVTTVLLGILAVSLSNPEMAQQLRAQMAKSSASTEEVSKFLEMLQTVSGVSSLLLIVLVSSTLLMGLGGAMGALFGRRSAANHPHT